MLAAVAGDGKHVYMFNMAAGDLLWDEVNNSPSRVSFNVFT
jgi:hypothetical protein